MEWNGMEGNSNTRTLVIDCLPLCLCSFHNPLSTQILVGFFLSNYFYYKDNFILYLFDFRSGKSSIYKVVFHKMSPTETLFLESTSKIVKEDVTNSSFVQFSVWDFPGQIDIFDPTFNADAIFGGTVHSRLKFRVDIQM